MQNGHILLMHISNVSGHCSASLAIEKAIKAESQQEIETSTLNALNYVHPYGEKVVNFFYMFLIKRLPFIWGYFYDNPYLVRKSQRLKEIIHYLKIPKLTALINDFKPDAVVATQAFPCGMVADFKRIKGVNLPIVAVLTDFIPHSFWVYKNVDYYVVPSSEAKDRLIKEGIVPNRIKTFGIPFDPKFNQDLDKLEVRKKLNLNEKTFTILIMGGGQGLGPIKNIIKLLDDLPFDLQEVVVCGTNKKVYKLLKKRLGSYKKEIFLSSYAQNIDEFMSAADIIITKPGGITCAEALTKKLPILIVSPIPGQEANNAKYLISQGAAKKVERPHDLINIVTTLYKKPDRLKELSDSASRISRPNSSRDIANLLLELSR